MALAVITHEPGVFEVRAVVVLSARADGCIRNQARDLWDCMGNATVGVGVLRVVQSGEGRR